MIYLSGNHPFIQLRVKIPKTGWKKLDCLIDTGFSGGIALPKNFRQNFSEDKFIESRFTLADGSEMMTDVTYTKVEYDGKEKEVAIVFIGDLGCLVGVEFLDQMKFCLDLKAKKATLSI